jgi:glucose/arabinose dehydrogenase
MKNQPDGVDEEFGGVASNIQVPIGFQADAVVSNLLAPTAVAFAPDGRMFIAQKTGIVQAWHPGSNTVTQVLDIHNQVNSPITADQGLTAMVLDPNFAQNHFMYLYYTVKAAEPACSDVRTVARVSRFTVEANGQADQQANIVGTANAIPVGTCPPPPGPGDPPVYLPSTCPSGASSDCLPSDAYTHSSGSLAFGQDGKLWIGVPDGASPEGPDDGGIDPLALRAQNQDSLAGKLLRVEPATGDGVSSNPQYDSNLKRSPRSRTWARGFRNPFRFAQRPDGQSWYVGDVGWGEWEEIDRVPNAKGAYNYAWPCREGPSVTAYTYESDEPYQTVCPDTDFLDDRVDPLHYYNSFGVEHAVIGGTFYTGAAYPSPWKPAAGRNAYYFTDYPSGVITLLDTNSADGDVQIASFAGGFTGPVQIIQGPVDPNVPAGDKALYVVNIGSIANPDGRVWRITYP